MFVRSVIAATVVAALGLAAPALARPAAKPSVTSSIKHTAASAPRGVDPARVLAGGSRGFTDRTANLGAIMGPETGAARMQIPIRPEHPRGLHREADATASVR